MVLILIQRTSDLSFHVVLYLLIEGGVMAKAQQFALEPLFIVEVKLNARTLFYATVSNDFIFSGLKQKNWVLWLFLSLS